MKKIAGLVSMAVLTFALPSARANSIDADISYNGILGVINAPGDPRDIQTSWLLDLNSEAVTSSSGAYSVFTPNGPIDGAILVMPPTTITASHPLELFDANYATGNFGFFITSLTMVDTPTSFTATGIGYAKAPGHSNTEGTVKITGSVGRSNFGSFQVAVAVPDEGSTAVLYVLALVGLCLFGRWFRDFADSRVAKTN